MPDPIALISPAAPSAPAPAASQTAGETGSGADFSSALAALADAPAPPAADLPPADPAAAPQPAVLSLIGARLPQTGKNLPLGSAGPDATAGTKSAAKPRADEPDDRSVPDAPAGVAPLAAVLPLPPASDPAPPTPPVPAPAAASTAPAALPPAAPQAAAEPAPRAPTARLSPETAPPVTNAVQLRAAFAEGGEAKGYGANPDGGTVRSDGTLAAPAIPAASPTLAAHFAALTVADAAPAAAPAPSPQAQPAGQNLSALVERLVEARGAAQAGNPAAPVSATVNHAEFGRIAVHFSPDGGGLNVTLSSPDPAFAGAAQAALTVTSSAGGEGAQFFDGRGAGAGGLTSGRQDSGGALAGNGTGGNGNPTPREAPRFADNQRDHVATPATTGSGATGIFA